MGNYHTSVLLNEVLEYLKIEKGKRYIDGTLGGGGHTFEIIKRGGIVLGIDQDDDALNYVTERAEKDKEVRLGKNLFLAKGNFKDLVTIAKENKFEEVNGVLLDIGVSLHQLQTDERGFSFLRNGPLDMRMDQRFGVPAKDLVNGLYKKELVTIFEKYGEEEQARKIADAICKEREVKKFETTGDLASLITRIKRGGGKVHPATKVFQALRIVVNDELGSLEKALSNISEILGQNGRVLVITFHSLEDRIVKEFFSLSREFKPITARPITPTDEEIFENKRARSSKLRVYEKI